MRIEPKVRPDLLTALGAMFGAGAEPAEAPMLQPLNLLLELAGETMRSRLFVVHAEGGEELCLRPDFTVALARAHVASGRSEGRYWYQGPVYRSAAGSDQPEEFVQLGMEWIDKPAVDIAKTDATLAAIAWSAVALGGRDDLSLVLGDIALFAAFVGALDLPPALATRLARIAGRPRLLQAELNRREATPSTASGLARRLAGLGPEEAGAFLEEVWELAGVQPVGGRAPAEIAARLVRKAQAAAQPALTDAQAQAIRAFMAIDDAPASALAAVRRLAGRGAAGLEAALEAWDQRLEGLAQAVPEDRLRFAPALGHAFDYYDGLVFEVRSATLGASRPVAVGGRYDGLLARLGGRADGRAVGCMVRPWRAWSEGEA